MCVCLGILRIYLSSPLSNTIDIDECAAGNSNDCDNTGYSVCTNNIGSYDCTCTQGNFSGLGTTSNPCSGKIVSFFSGVKVLLKNSFPVDGKLQIRTVFILCLALPFEISV